MAGISGALSVDGLCVDLSLDASIDDLKIIFPGDVELKISLPSVDIQGAIDAAKALLGSLNAALMPLQPIFSLIDVVIAIKNVLTAIPDAITSLDPGKITKAIPKLLAKLDAVLSMIPPLSIPILIKTALHVVVVFLQGLYAQLKAIVDVQVKIDGINTRASALRLAFPDIAAQLDLAFGCATAQASAQMSGIAQGAKPIDALLGLMGTLVESIGLPIKIPTISGSLGASAEATLAPLKALTDVLNDIYISIII